MIKAIWKQVKENLVTPGGDPCWECPICGHSRHVYGVENINNPKYKCEYCGKELKYPFEVNNDRNRYD